MSSRRKFLAPLREPQWPAADQALWRHACRDDPLDFDGVGPAARWRPDTLKAVALNYGVWLAWLRERGELCPDSRPGARATLDRLRRYLEDMQWSGYADASCVTRLSHLAAALRVLDPGYDSKRISRAAGRLQSAAIRSRSLTVNPGDLTLLLDHARALRRSAPDDAATPVEQALRFRDGLLLALLVHRPLRVANLAGIEIGRHLTATSSGFALSFEAHEMKAHRDFQFSLPHLLCAPMRRYLTEFRPRLAARSKSPVVASALWLGQEGVPLTGDSVGKLVRRRTRAALGVGIGPHKVRHIAVTLLAEEAPELGDAGAMILAHQDQRTTEQHYVHARAGRAAERLDDALEALRSRGS